MNLKLPDARGWVGLGVYAMAAWCIVSLALWPDIAEHEFTKLIYQGIILQAFVQSVVGFYFIASKSGVDLAERNQGIVEAAAANPTVTPVVITNDVANAVPVEQAS